MPACMVVEEEKQKIMAEAKAYGLIPLDDNEPEEPLPKWMVLKIALKIIKRG